MKQKWIAVLLFVLLLAACMAGCGSNDTADDHSANNGSADNVLPDNDHSDGRDNDDNNPDDRYETDEPVFPDTLAEADAEVALNDLIATLGLSAADLENAMRDVSTVGDNVEGARTYRHKLLGRESEVSYVFDDSDRIAHITVQTEKDLLEDWRAHLRDVLSADAVEGETDAWDYSGSRVRLLENGDRLTVTIEKPTH